jgi:hypothetical protein
VPSPNEPRSVTSAGLRLPLNETVVVLVTTFVLIIDYYHPLSLLNRPIGEELSIGIGAWRTRSVLYGALLHAYLIGLILVATSRLGS